MVYKLTAGMRVLDCEISAIRLLLERHAGVLLDKPAEVLIADIAEYLESRNMNSAADLIGVLRNFSGERDALLERLLPGDTAFFRYPGALETLERRVLPELKQRKNKETPRSLRIWSAGWYLHAHDSRAGQLRRPVRLHLLHGGSPAYLAQPAHVPVAAPASLSRTGRLPVSRSERENARC